jgi:hypothetical protein
LTETGWSIGALLSEDDQILKGVTELAFWYPQGRNRVINGYP